MTTAVEILGAGLKSSKANIHDIIKKELLLKASKQYASPAKASKQVKGRGIDISS